MKKMNICEVRYGVAEGGFACGPIDGPVVAEVKITNGNQDEDFYMCLSEFEGYPNFYKSSESMYDVHMKRDITDDEIMWLDERFIEVGLYDELFGLKNDPLFDLYRYLIYVVRASYEDTDNFIEETKGKYLEDVEIPVSDVEEEYWIMQEDMVEDDE